MSGVRCGVPSIAWDPKPRGQGSPVCNLTEEPQTLLIALRHVAEARGGMAKIAKASGIERESLYRALSPRGNPRLSTLFAVTKAMGLTLTVETSQR